MGNTFFMKKVKSLREQAGLTMQQLADALCVTKSRVNMWESAGTVPRQDVLIRLAQYFNVPTDDLLGNITAEGGNELLHSLQRNLKKLNDDQIKKANKAMKLLFDDIWTDEEEHGDL